MDSRRSLAKQTLVLPDGVGGPELCWDLGSRGHRRRGALPWAGGQRLGRHRECTQLALGARLNLPQRALDS